MLQKILKILCLMLRETRDDDYKLSNINVYRSRLSFIYQSTRFQSHKNGKLYFMT